MAFKIKREMFSHMRNKHNAKPYKCEKCEETFSRQLELMEHKASCSMKVKDHEGQEFMDMTTKRIRPSTESGHNEDEENEEPTNANTLSSNGGDFKCKYCERSFNRPEYLRYHTLLHTGQF